MMRTSDFAASERAQSVIEVALLLPLLVFVLLGGADLARAFALQLAVQNGARAGAEAAAIDNTPTRSAARDRALDEMGRTPALDPAAATVTVDFKLADGLTDCTAGAVPSVAVPCYAVVRVQYTFRTVTAWPLIPNTATFDRTTTMRMLNAP